MKFTKLEKHKAALREVALRKNVYRKRVENKWMTQAEADREIAIMQEIADEYGMLAKEESKS
jgi:hypothetical protein